MATHFSVVLDTTGPQLVWGTPSPAEAGSQLTIPFVLDEIAVPPLFASLRDPQGNLYSGLATGGEVRISIPEDAYNGVAQVELILPDEVGNQSTHTLLVAITGGVDYVDPLAAQVEAGRARTLHSAGPAEPEYFAGETHAQRLRREDEEILLLLL